MPDSNDNITLFLFRTLENIPMPVSLHWVVSIVLSVSLFFLLGYAVHYIKRRLIPKVSQAIVTRTPFKWDDKLEKHGVFLWVVNTLIALWFVVLAKTFFGGLIAGGIDFGLLTTSIANILFIATVVMLIDAALNGLLEIYRGTAVSRQFSIKGFIQAVKLIVFLCGFIFTLSVILGKSPIFFLSGLGAITAVLMLVFKDPILGFVAGIQISANRMLRVGDWIEMPTHMADGDVIDISLTTVKVQNWDKTITTVPSYELISRPFKNWSGMQDSGGRRIKRSIMIDLRTIRFADAAMIDKFRKIKLISGYIDRKCSEIEAHNSKLGIEPCEGLNGRTITNIGTFRAYCEAYLQSHPGIHKDMTFLIRQLEPTPEGLPIEIYVFTSDTRWVQYEGIQSDIFDHLFAILPHFGLAPYQSPSGNDLERVGLTLRDAMQDRI